MTGVVVNIGFGGTQVGDMKANPHVWCDFGRGSDNDKPSTWDKSCDPIGTIWFYVRN